jgi:hypothetical protein
MAASYISVPRDLTKVKSKVMFNLTKRQLICFGVAALLGVPSFFLIKQIAATSAAAIGMMVIMMPFFFLAMYEKNGQHLEVILGHLIEATFVRPKERPYKTNNYYDVLHRCEVANEEIMDIYLYNQCMRPDKNRKGKEKIDFDQYFQEKRKKGLSYTVKPH